MRYFDMGKSTMKKKNDLDTFTKQTMEQAVKALEQKLHQRLTEDMLIYGTSYTHIDPDDLLAHKAGTQTASKNPSIPNNLPKDFLENIRYQYEKQVAQQKAMEYEWWRQKNTDIQSVTNDYWLDDYPSPPTKPYTDPPPSVANSPTCPQCSRLLLRTDATWAPDRYYWTCIYHGLWRKLDGKIIPPHPDDSDNCGHWIKDGMLWVCERQRWECLTCRNGDQKCQK